MYHLWMGIVPNIDSQLYHSFKYLQETRGVTVGMEREVWGVGTKKYFVDVLMSVFHEVLTFLIEDGSANPKNININEKKFTRFELHIVGFIFICIPLKRACKI